MLLIATALVLALSQAALAAAGLGLAPTPTAKQHVAAIFARQTGRRVLDDCSSVLDNFLDLPTPPPDLSSYAAQVAATQTGAAAIRFPDSLSSRASKYQSSVLSWCSEQRDALTKCTELPALQSQYSGICQAAGVNGGTELGINIFNNADTGGGGGGAGGAGGSAGGGGGGGGAGGSNGNNNGGDGSSGGGGISSGAVAGIVIGVLAAVGVLAGIAAFVIWRGRRKRAAANAMDAARQQPMSGQQTPPESMLHGLGRAYDKDSPAYSEGSYQTLPHERSVHEMPGVRAPAELMGSTEAVPVELHNPEPVYEMLADYRPNKAAVAGVGYKS
ncbi:hypothetical protein MHUMG1_08760 [Metarhizium humberi]|uniref:Uncharacterized protein n=1 Tax=Metarhizium humberi TaxID=2596975 RepID=A0A9P8M4Z9_9HYPO|nr:hypothetical protein MHUMG1_08760 [Metarhizium humberi]